MADLVFTLQCGWGLVLVQDSFSFGYVVVSSVGSFCNLSSAAFFMV
jgi:hypothetical protein